MMRGLPIAWRLAGMFALTAAVVFSSVAYYLYCVLSDSVREKVRNELVFHHSLMDPVLMKSDTPAEWAQIRGKLDRLSQEGGRVQYWIQSPDPRFEYATPTPVKVHKLWSTPDGRFGFMRLGSDERIWSVLHRTIPASNARPALQFTIALDATPYIHMKEGFTRVMTISATLGILLVAVLGYWIAKLGLQPVRRLSRQALALPPNNPRERLDVAGLPPEVRAMAQAFNQSLERREAAWMQLEGFNADVAHELRTPLTNLIGQTQVALAHERHLEALKDLLASNLEELERMSNIVNDMLFLSHAENGNRAAELSDIWLHAEAAKTADYLEHAFSQRDMTVQIRGDAQARADRRLFHRALANLLSNSARYAHASTEVIVSITTQGNTILVSVVDHGAPIPLAQQERLFERFYRGDKARTGSGMHHGLGLSIVRAIAAMHGGDVFVHSQGGLNTFGFTLPRAVRETPPPPQTRPRAGVGLEPATASD